MKEKFTATPKGIIYLATLEDKDIWTYLELYCLRHGYNAILVDEDGGKFIHVGLANEKKKSNKNKR